MQKNWDTIAVGVITFIVVAIILANKPGYTPLSVEDNTPAATEEAGSPAEATAEANGE
jgi:hypothetical protein